MEGRASKQQRVALEPSPVPVSFDVDKPVPHGHTRGALIVAWKSPTTCGVATYATWCVHHGGECVPKTTCFLHLHEECVPKINDYNSVLLNSPSTPHHEMETGYIFRPEE